MSKLLILLAMMVYAWIAEELGVTNRYVSMVLNGHRDPPGAEERFTAAVRRIIDRTNAAKTAEAG